MTHNKKKQDSKINQISELSKEDFKAAIRIIFQDFKK
jgi:hypothetical protein